MIPQHVTCSSCRQEYEVETPTSAMKYLAASGWAVADKQPPLAPDQDRPYWIVVQKDINMERALLEIPNRQEAVDYPRRFFELVVDICRIESRSPLDVLADIRKAGQTL